MVDIMSVLDPWVAIPSVSIVVYLIYKEYEPSNPVATLLLLGLIPASLVAALREHFDTAIAAAFTVCLTYWTLIAGLVIGYRLSPFHPLFHYPGPLLCKISKCWLAYVVGWRGDAHLYIRDLHQRYGDVVRTGPNELSITHRDFTEALGPKGLPKGPYYDTRRQQVITSLNGIRDPAEHAVRRRPWTKGMNSASMKYFEELIRETVGDLVTSLKQRTGSPLDLSKWMTYFGFDFMGRMAFTHHYGMLRDGHDKDNLTPLTERAMGDVAWISHVSWAVRLLRTVPRANKYWTAYQALSRRTVQHRIARGSTHHDLFFHLLGEDHEAEPNLALASTDGQLAIIAGADTTAAALSHLFYFLLQYPAYFKRLRKEVDQAFPRGEGGFTLDFTRLASMPYMNACINEALRIYPPVLAGLQRRVEPGTGGKMIGPYYIPEKTQVTFSPYTVHRDSRYFSPLTNAFWPDRWLSQEKYTLPNGDSIGADEVVTNRDVFFPFSQGPAVCAGKMLALTEIRAVMCALLQTFDIQIADQFAFDNWEAGIREMFTTKRSTLPVIFSLRE